MGIFDKLKKAWNAFNDKDIQYYTPIGTSSYYNPYRVNLSTNNERSIVNAIFNRIANDCASIDICHVRLDDKNRYAADIEDDLNNCLTVEANKDQTSRAFFIDVVISMFDEGYVAIVPIDTDRDITKGTYSIYSMRVAKILEWYPDDIRVEAYNDRTGNKELLTLPKSEVAIIENPLYSIMNERNSVLQRLIRKLNLLDSIDEQTGSGKLDLIIQLPYIIKSQKRKDEAKSRIDDLQSQLAASKYGVAYMDGTEKITQLNRPVENNILKSVEYLTSMLYSQLGITQGVLDGTANESTMNNYITRTVVPIVRAIAEEMNRKFLTQTARTQKQRIVYKINPFIAIPISKLAEIADKFTRNEILTSNEVRQVIGYPPVDTPEADELRNKNLNKDGSGSLSSEQEPTQDENNLEGGEIQNGEEEV